MSHGTWTEEEYEARGYRTVKLRLLDWQREKLERLRDLSNGEPMNAIVGRLIEEEYRKVAKR